MCSDMVDSPSECINQMCKVPNHHKLAVFAVSVKHRFQEALQLLCLCPPRLLFSHRVWFPSLWWMEFGIQAQEMLKTNPSNEMVGVQGCESSAQRWFDSSSVGVSLQPTCLFLWNSQKYTACEISDEELSVRVGYREPHKDTSPRACATGQFFRNQAKAYLMSTIVPTLCVNHKVVVSISEEGGGCIDFLFNP